MSAGGRNARYRRRLPNGSRLVDRSGLRSRWRSRAERRTNEKSHVQRRLQRKTCAPPRHHVHHPPRVRPSPKLLAVHPEFTTRDFAYLFIHVAQLELTDLKAHRRAAITAAAGLMEHERAIFLFQRFDQLTGGVRHADAIRGESNYISH